MVFTHRFFGCILGIKNSSFVNVCGGYMFFKVFYHKRKQLFFLSEINNAALLWTSSSLFLLKRQNCFLQSSFFSSVKLWFEWCGILHCVNHYVRCFLHDIEYSLLLYPERGWLDLEFRVMCLPYFLLTEISFMLTKVKELFWPKKQGFGLKSEILIACFNCSWLIAIHWPQTYQWGSVAIICD